MSLHAIGRMIIAPAGAAVAVGIRARPLGPAASLLAFATFFVVQLGIFAWSRRRLEHAKRRLVASRARRRRLRCRP